MARYIKITIGNGGHHFYESRKNAIYNIDLCSYKGSITETVRILNADEEKEFAWEWYKKSYTITRISTTEYDEISELYIRNQFEKEWKEQGNVNTRSYKVRETI